LTRKNLPIVSVLPFF